VVVVILLQAVELLRAAVLLLGAVVLLAVVVLLLLAAVQLPVFKVVRDRSNSFQAFSLNVCCGRS